MSKTKITILILSMVLIFVFTPFLSFYFSCLLKVNNKNIIPNILAGNPISINNISIDSPPQLPSEYDDDYFGYVFRTFISGILPYIIAAILIIIAVILIVLTIKIIGSSHPKKWGLITITIIIFSILMFFNPFYALIFILTIGGSALMIYCLIRLTIKIRDSYHPKKWGLITITIIIFSILMFFPVDLIFILTIGGSALMIYGIIRLSIKIRDSKYSRDVEKKIYGERIEVEWLASQRKEKEEMERREREEKEKKIELEKRFQIIENLIKEKKFSNGIRELNDLMDDLILNKAYYKKLNLREITSWAEEKLDLCKKLEVKEKVSELFEKIDRVKKTVLELGTKFPRLQIAEISEVCVIKDEELIINTVKEMINNKEIYAQYFSSTKSVAFNQQANIEEIDKLMKSYKEWEDKKVGKN